MRIPKRLQDADNINEWKRGTMRTKGPVEAERNVRADLDDLERTQDSVPARIRIFEDLKPLEQRRVDSEVAKNVAALPMDQKQLIQKAGPAGTAMKEQEVDLSRFGSAPLIAYFATKEINYGTNTDG